MPFGGEASNQPPSPPAGDVLMPTMATGNRTLAMLAAVEHLERKVRDVAPWPRAVCTAAATSGINAHRDTETAKDGRVGVGAPEHVAEHV